MELQRDRTISAPFGEKSSIPQVPFSHDNPGCTQSVADADVSLKLLNVLLTPLLRSHSQ